jgi:hypothetical protein
MTGSDTFGEPTDLSQAEGLRAQLTKDVQGIQAQLGDRERTDDNGKRLTPKEYWAWKKRAQHALNQKLDHLRSVKSWLRAQRKALSLQNEEVPEDSALLHLKNLCDIVAVLEGDDVDFEDKEKSQIDAANTFLHRVTENHNPTAA